MHVHLETDNISNVKERILLFSILFRDKQINKIGSILEDNVKIEGHLENEDLKLKSISRLYRIQ